MVHLIHSKIFKYLNNTDSKLYVSEYSLSTSEVCYLLWQRQTVKNPKISYSWSVRSYYGPRDRIWQEITDKSCSHYLQYTFANVILVSGSQAHGTVITL